MSDRVVYHYTDSLHLPWIVKSSELRPNTNRLIGIGLIKYIWATTNPAGDKTARAMITMHKGYEELFQHGLVQLIRFTLPSAGFVPWCDIKRESNWTRGQIRKLQQSDRKYFDEHGFAKWRCRREPLPITSALKVEAKLWGEGWRPIKATRKYCAEISDDPPIMAFIINNVHYYSQQFTSENDHHTLSGYTIPDREELVEILAKKWEVTDCKNRFYNHRD